MTTPQITIFSLLFFLFVMLVWGRWRYDVVAFLTLMIAVVAGLVPAGDAFSGFGHPATVTVAAILVLSRALSTSGATDVVARLINPAARSTPLHIAALSSIAAVMSSFMNNVGTLGLLMPVAVQTAEKAKRAASLLLMPLSFGSILGGLVTLIGTPPNIIIATYREDVSGAAFGMFDFAPVGAVTALVGVLFIAFIGWRLMPKVEKSATSDHGLFDIENYVTELLVPPENKNIGMTLEEIDEAASDIDAIVVDLIRNNRTYPGAMTKKQIQAGDILKIEAGPEDIDKFLSKFELEIADREAADEDYKASEDKTLVEVVVAPGSRLDGRVIGSLRIFSNRHITLLGVSRQGKPFRGRLRTFRIRVGDVLLLHGEAHRLPDAVAATGCLPLAHRDLSFGRRQQARAMMLIFAAAIAATTFGLLPVQISFGLAVMAMVVTGLLPVRELYEGIDWPVIILLGSLIPVGGALATTGGTEIISGAILDLTAGFSAVVVLVLLMVVTMTLSDILNNAATAVVMAPIAVSIAGRLEVNSDPFLMVVAVAASCAFLTPIGHQNNALIMGPGGYRFGDYWRMGLPLEILIVAVSIPMIMWVWPL